MDVTVYSHVVVDDIEFTDGSHVDGIPGGAGTYAAVGAALVLAALGTRDGEMDDVPRVGVVAGVGDDYDRTALATRRVSTDGLHVTDPLTPRTRVRYLPDGERIETSQHGDEHFDRAAPWPTDTPHPWRPRAVYAFRDLDPRFWREIDEIRSRRPVVVVWEVHAGICAPQHRDAVLDRAGRVDAISLNRAEAAALLGAGDITSWIRDLHAAGARTVAIRLGSAGAALGRDGRVMRASPAPGQPVVDPTGAGNAFSGALTAALGLEFDTETALRQAMGAAACTIGGFGPPAIDDATLRAFARASERTTIDTLSRTTPDLEGTA